MSDAIFSAESIAKSFGNRKVLRTGSFWARSGQIVAMLGRNGNGKTTLFRIAVGLLRADSGAIRFRGKHIERPRHAALAREGVFYLPERGLLSHSLRLSTHLDALKWYWPESDVSSIVETFGLAEHLSKRVDVLSGGERRRAELAIALARRPTVLLADEPFQGIAPVDAEVIGEMIVHLARQGCAVVVTGHEVPQLFHVADEIIWLNEGATVGVGNVLDARMNEQFQRGYLNFRA